MIVSTVVSTTPETMETTISFDFESVRDIAEATERLS